MPSIARRLSFEELRIVRNENYHFQSGFYYSVGRLTTSFCHTNQNLRLQVNIEFICERTGSN